MARILLGPLAADASGSIAGGTLQRGPAGHIARTRSLPSPRSSPASTSARQATAQLATMWRTLTVGQRSLWTAQAASTIWRDRFGIPRPMRGYWLFLRNNLQLLHAGIAPLSVPAAPTALPPLPSVTLSLIAPPLHPAIADYLFAGPSVHTIPGTPGPTLTPVNPLGTWSSVSGGVVTASYPGALYNCGASSVVLIDVLAFKPTTSWSGSHIAEISAPLSGFIYLGSGGRVWSNIGGTINQVAGAGSWSYGVAKDLHLVLDQPVTLSQWFGCIGSFGRLTMSPAPIVPDVSISWSGPPDPSASLPWVLYASPPLSPGLSSPRQPLNILQLLTSPTPNPYDLQAAYLATFGALGLPGQKSFFELATLDAASGTMGPRSRQSGIWS